MLKRELGEDVDVGNVSRGPTPKPARSPINLDERLNLQATSNSTDSRDRLIEMFPVETLEDFVLCFKRGALGFYGTIFKVDASVLCDWMFKYLDEKYQLVEAKATEGKIKLDKENEVNYEAFKARAPEILAKDNT